ncbi:extracellular solute-binding protein [Georgenia phoenicis]|uniref:ABC transporter substrate-binding protein n=1 Tax=unclassified Georgenia TaxID=2626815 RepID=UPI0039B01B89
MDRRARARAGAALVIAAALAACGEPASDEAAVDPSAGMATVTFRLWDDAAADAYRESFDAFNAVHRDIHVEVEVVPEPGYADRTASDLADGTMADIFWTTSDAVAAHAHAGDIVELDEALGEDLEEWEPAVTELYTRDDGLWAVPQLWDSTVLFYNTALVERAGVDPEALVWDPDAGREETPTGGATPAPATDTLRQAVRALTRDGAGHAATDGGFSPQDVTEHGINPDLTAPAVWLPLLAQLGGLPPTGDDLSLTTPEARATFDYLTRLPAAASRVATPARELFTTGRLALFWSTSADMRHVAAGTDVDWGLAPVPSGPDGTVAVADGVGAAANAASADPEATAEVLRWLASTDGQSALASHGVGIPAATGAQELFLRSWADRGVDASAAVDPQELVTAASGPRAREVLTAVRPVLDRMFRGELPVAEALAAADQVLAP